jgi:SAM-dependent methyltransferase
MNFYRRSDFTPDDERLLADYDRQILALLPPGFAFPVRMRDWELRRVLEATASLPPGARILDTGAFNTYLGLHLGQTSATAQVTVSDLLRARAIKSALRKVGLAPAKPTEVGYLTWSRLMRQHGLTVSEIDLTRIRLPDASFDCIISLSVIEHIPAIERALAEMYRVLAPGGRLLITTDCSPEPVPYADGVRYFSEAELERLFAAYPVTSPRNRPDFSPENWCYGGKFPVVTSFVEITKPR